METLPQAWPFPDSVIGRGSYDDQRAARKQIGEVAAMTGNLHKRNAKTQVVTPCSDCRPPTQPIDVSAFDAPY